MRLEKPTASFWLAVAAGVLGLIVLAGYCVHSAALERLHAGPNAATGLAAVSLILAALAVILARRAQTVFAALLLAWNIAVIGRAPAVINAGFLLMSVAILWLPYSSRRRSWIVRWLTWLAIAAGVVGASGYFLRFDLLYSFHALTRTSFLSGAGLLLVGLALWLSWREARWNRSPMEGEQASRILSAATLALVVVIAVAAFSGLLLVQRIARRDAATDLALRRDERTSYIRALIEEAAQRGRMYARQPALRQLLRGKPMQALPKAPSQVFSSITLYRDGHAVAHSGPPELRSYTEVVLPLGPAVELLWKGDFFLRQRLPVTAGRRGLGSLVLEQPLLLLGRIGMEAAAFGNSGEIGLCGLPAPHAPVMTCFPQRLHAQPFTQSRSLRGVPHPMALALDGKSGVADTIDYRGQRVLAAYAPIPGLGMGLVVKMDSRELYAPIRREIEILGPLLVILAVGGLELLRWQVRPLVRELVQSRNQVSTSEARFRAAAESGMDPFYIFESERDRGSGGITGFRLIYANQPGEEFAALEPGRGEPLALTSVPQLAAANAALDHLRRVVVTRKSWVEELTIDQDRERDGSADRTRWLHVQATALGDGVAVTLRDISERKREEVRLRTVAQTDALTGLANRITFHNRLTQALGQLGRRGRDKRLLAVLFLDIDHFKAVNDTYGHVIGDQVLHAFAARLQRSVRSADTVARRSGDEFTILLENLESPHDAERVIAAIYAAMEDPIHLDGLNVQLATSIGVAFYRGEEGNGADEILAQADAALYAAKRAGRNTWRVWGPDGI
ncbi:MAG: diguanylate cyclase domain-containing protein [Terriglobales bacterium]